MDPLALFYHPEMLEHETGQHPERRARLEAVADLFTREGLSMRGPDPASVGQVGRVHVTGHVAGVERLARTGGAFDVDTVASRGSYRAALRAAGGAAAAVAAVLRGDARRAFALVRPPGHHARPGQAMGFCLFNNVAIAAREAQAAHGLQRIAIVDIDVHHGNGTQESFWEDPSILFISTHEYPYYPGSGALTEIGVGDGRGTTVNVPLPAGCGDAEYLRCTDDVIVPALRRFAPELILVSIGFDAHWGDPLAQMQLTIAGYVAIVERVAVAADELCRGRLALVLEGGYSLEALAYGALAVTRALRGEAWSDPLGASPYHARSVNLSEMLTAARTLHALGEGARR